MINRADYLVLRNGDLPRSEHRVYDGSNTQPIVRRAQDGSLSFAEGWDADRVLSWMLAPESPFMLVPKEGQ